jgi:hypothetical protein
MLSSFEWYDRIGKAKTNSALLNAWDKSVKDTNAAQLIRLRLGLPPAGKGCPKT